MVKFLHMIYNDTCKNYLKSKFMLVYILVRCYDDGKGPKCRAESVLPTITGRPRRRCRELVSRAAVTIVNLAMTDMLEQAA